ncbi:MAG: EamA family transporter [Syntrophomonadaceae bacterium]|nr:EamA family transporter [Syntrophomonadaceae bacterium]
MSVQNTARWKAVGALALTIIFFSTFEVVSKKITYRIEPMQINYLRFLLGGFLLLPLALADQRKRSVQLHAGDFKSLFWLGFLNVTLCLSLFQISIKYIPASTAAVIFCTNPIFVHIFEAWRGQHYFSRYQVLGLTCASVGLFIVAFHEVMMGSGSWLGTGLAMFSAVSYGLFIVQARQATQEMGSLTVNSISFILGALACIPALLYFDIPLLTFDYGVWPWLVYLTVIVTSLAYYLFLYGLEHLPPGAGSLIFFIKPVLATALAAYLLDESISNLFVLGTLVIIFGLWLYTRKHLQGISSQ